MDINNILLPGEANFSDAEFELIEDLLERHRDLTQAAMVKIKHIRETNSEDKDE